MILVKEKLMENNSIAIQVDGILDSETTPILREAFSRHLKEQKGIFLHMEGLLHVSREGRSFLREIGERIIRVDPGGFMNRHNL